MRVGIIGGGFIAQIAHIEPLSRVARVELVALCEPDNALRNRVADRFAIPQRFDRPEPLIALELDAVVVALPMLAQELVVEQVLATGTSVLSEKPMATTPHAAQRLVELAERTGARWAVGFMKRHDAGVVRLAQLVERALVDRRWGRLLHVSMRDFCGEYGATPPDHFRRDGSRQWRYPESPCAPNDIAEHDHSHWMYSLNVLSHDINLLHHLLGELHPNSFAVHEGGVQRLAMTSNHCPVDLVAGPARFGRWDQRLDFTFETALVSCVLPSPLDSTAEATVTVASKEGTEVLADSDAPRWAFDHQSKNFVTALEKGDDFINSAARCLRDMDVIHSMWTKTNETSVD